MNGGIGRLLQGRYQILEAFSHKGMNQVYYGVDLHTGEELVFKCTRETKEQLRQEKEILERLLHPAIPQVKAFFEEEGETWLLLNYVEGETLQVCVKEQGGLTEAEIRRLGEELLGILGYLHAQEPPVLHGDLKPANILLDEKRRVYLIDFGTAAEQRQGSFSGTAFGTRGYAAPEQYSAAGLEQEGVDARADLYALGVILSELLTGRTGVQSREAYEELVQEKQLKRVWQQLLIKSTAANREERFADADDFLKSLKKTGKKLLLGRNRTLREPLSYLPETEALSDNSGGGQKSARAALPKDFFQLQKNIRICFCSENFEI